MKKLLLLVLLSCNCYANIKRPSFQDYELNYQKAEQAKVKAAYGNLLASGAVTERFALDRELCLTDWVWVKFPFGPGEFAVYRFSQAKADALAAGKTVEASSLRGPNEKIYTCGRNGVIE